MSERDSECELRKAFVQFSEEKQFITFDDLKAVSEDLGENMTDDELREMLFEANQSDREGVVDIE